MPLEVAAGPLDGLPDIAVTRRSPSVGPPIAPAQLSGRRQRSSSLARERRPPCCEARSGAGGGDEYTFPQVDLATGFPVPILYNVAGTEGGSARPVRQQGVSRSKSGPRHIHAHHDAEVKDIQPVFRTSPYAAEIQREQRHADVARILFLDECNLCRSVLAEALMSQMLKGSPLAKVVQVESASIGPAFNGGHDSRVQKIAEEMGIELLPHEGKVFNEVTDIVECDLVIVMDRFDHEEVYREVAVLDTINPGGYYCSRIKLLSEFTTACEGNMPEVMEINDPLYGNFGGPQEQEELRKTVRLIQFASQGLMNYLMLLQQRCAGSVSLPLAVSQSLRCPLMDGTAKGRVQRLQSIWKPVWRANGAEAGEFFTIQMVRGRKKVVKKNMGQRRLRGYWTNASNVEKELREWMDEYDHAGSMPKHRELAETGATALSSAIVRHGGMAKFARRLGMDCQPRKSKGYWQDFSNVLSEVEDWISEYGTAGVLPTREELRSTGHGTLSNAVAEHGGMEAVAGQLGLVIRRQRYGYWQEEGQLLKELEPLLMQDSNGNKVLPTQQQLHMAGRLDVMGGIQRAGGWKSVAEKLGLKSRKQRRRSADEVKADIVEFMVSSGALRTRLPTKVELEKAGRADLAADVVHIGGFRRLSNSMGFGSGLNGIRASFDDLEGPALRNGRVSPGGSSSASDSRLRGREAARQLSGAAGWCRLDGAVSRGRARMPRAIELGGERRWAIGNEGHAVTVENFQEEMISSCVKELKAFIESECIESGRMPLSKELMNGGRKDLYYLIRKCGGSKIVAEHMGLKFVETRGRPAAKEESGGPLVSL
eukprot:evm.model.scf_547EXC.6 EVM.evm.TU.scf_547EXC.6   scf_547EXC:65618-75162(-)